MSAARQAGSSVRGVGNQDDIRAGLAALRAQMQAMEVRMDERFQGLADLIDAKLGPVRDMATEQRALVQDHEQRITRLETAGETQIMPAVEQTWRTKKDVQALQAHAERYDKRSETSSNRWWGVAQGIIIAIAGIIIGWLGSLIWAGLGR